MILAFITRIIGLSGSYMAEFLLEKGSMVKLLL